MILDKQAMALESLSPLPGQFRQPAAGNRAGLAAVLLAYFPTLTKGTRALDLGTGSGLIPLLLAFREPSLTLVGVESQPLLASLAAQNMDLNGFSESFTIYEADVTTLLEKQPALAASFDLVVSNPPFYLKNKERLAAKQSAVIAKFAGAEDFAVWTRVTARLLKSGGRFCFILPASRFLESLTTLGKLNFSPVRLSWVYPKPSKKPLLFLLEAVYQGKFQPLRALPDIYP